MAENLGRSSIRTLKNRELVKLEKPDHGRQNLLPFFIISLLTISLFYLFFLSFGPDYKVSAQNQNQSQTILGPTLTDPTLKIETVVRNLEFPTSIEFLGNGDILLLEKNTGDVYRILDGNVTGPLIHIDVSHKDERGLLGIAVSEIDKSNKDKSLVFLYYTQCTKDKVNVSQDCRNYVYQYQLDLNNNKLIAPKLILDLPSLPGPSHNGGKLLIDKEKNIFVTTGDLQPTAFNKNQIGFDTKAQNIVNGTPPDGRAGILRITQDGKPVGDGILGSDYPLNLYYAYGVKNSFGIGIDPITGNLWDTENGPQFGDEINLIKPGFNSGWEKVQGIWKLNQIREKEGIFNYSNKEVGLVDFNGKGVYSNPEFVWDKPVGPTALVFLDSDKLGQQYTNDLFVGSVKKGTIFHFDLKPDRESLDLTGDLADLVYSKKEDSSKIVFGENFGIVTDLKVGPDGYLYVVSGVRDTDEGAIYRIVPTSN